MYRAGRLLAALQSAALLLASFASAAQTVEPHAIIIGTGSVSGVYYPAGRAICRMVNQDRKQHGIRCSVESTDGSVYNLKMLRAGELDMAVVQSDWQHHAYKGTSVFKEQGPNQALRAIFSLHRELFTVVARANGGIEKFDDLKDRRVNIGNPGSGQRNTLEVLMKAKGWDNSAFKQATELNSTEQVQALCDNEVDAIVYTVGHPNKSIREATLACDSVLVAVLGPEVDKLVRDHVYYTSAVIPGGMYRGNPEDVETFGVTATVVSSTATAEDIVYLTVKSVFEHFEDFRQSHPAFSKLEKQDMIDQGNTAPLHAGAERYYKEAGLLE